MEETAVMTDQQLEAAMLGSFELTPHDKLLHELAVEYHQRTEAYDRTVCSGPIGRDGIMPATARETALVNRNALHVLKELTQRAGGDREGLRRAIRSTPC